MKVKNKDEIQHKRGRILLTHRLDTLTWIMSAADLGDKGSVCHCLPTWQHSANWWPLCSPRQPAAEVSSEYWAPPTWRDPREMANNLIIYYVAAAAACVSQAPLSRRSRSPRHESAILSPPMKTTCIGTEPLNRTFDTAIATISDQSEINVAVPTAWKLPFFISYIPVSFFHCPFR